jgi:hypothetical protein
LANLVFSAILLLASIGLLMRRFGRALCSWPSWHWTSPGTSSCCS